MKILGRNFRASGRNGTHNLPFPAGGSWIFSVNFHCVQYLLLSISSTPTHWTSILYIGEWECVIPENTHIPLPWKKFLVWSHLASLTAWFSKCFSSRTSLLFWCLNWFDSCQTFYPTLQLLFIFSSFHLWRSHQYGCKKYFVYCVIIYTSTCDSHC